MFADDIIVVFAILEEDSKSSHLGSSTWPSDTPREHEYHDELVTLY